MDDITMTLEKLTEITDNLGTLLGHPPLAYTRTFGCQQNESDTERLQGQLARMGYDFTDDQEAAQLVLINTCAVREHAESRAFGHLGALTHWKAAAKGRILILCGCMAEQDDAAAKVRQSYPHVDLVFGTQAISRFPSLLYQVIQTRRRVFDDDHTDQPYDETIEAVRQPPPRANVPIMSGCNNFCSYCVVPYVRGRERSRTAAQIVNEVRELVGQGYKDITLLGQNVNSYGDTTHSFVALLHEICALEGDFWVRFMTSHPKDCTRELLETMATLPKMAKLLHLPFQSGSDAVLSKMNRGYTAAHYAALLQEARQLMPGLTVSSDIIVGFPEETEEDFLQTMALTKAAQLDVAYTFVYSPRRGTPAAAKPQLDRAVKQERFDRLLLLQNDISNAKHKALLDTVQTVLLDGYESDNLRPLTGRTSGGRLVRATGSASLVGQFAPVQITAHNSWNLFGEVVATR